MHGLETGKQAIPTGNAKQMVDDAREEPTGSAVCTIISKNYLAYARVLCASLRQFHPNLPVFVLLVDRVDGFFDPGKEDFHLVCIDDLRAIPDLTRFCFQYSILELNTAVKPYFLKYLFERHGFQQVMYLDPDILVTGNLSPLFSLLDHCSVVLTPHLTSPIEDNYRPNELDILRAGAYNLGFIALAKTASAEGLLDWWSRRLYRHCQMAHAKGMHVDQRWMDLVPGLFDGVHILKDPGYNVAYWNLHARPVEFNGECLFVNGQRCTFFHFSGFNPHDLSTISKHQNRFRVGGAGSIARLFRRYRELLFSNGYDEVIHWPYAFDRFSNGARIPEVARAMYLELGDQVNQFGNPFSVEGQRSYFNWLLEGAAGRGSSGLTINRLWYEIYHSRPDLQRAYPDLWGRDCSAFVDWSVTNGIKEHGVDEIFIRRSLRASSAPQEQKQSRRWYSRFYYKAVAPLEPTLKPVLKRMVGHNERIWMRLKRARNLIRNQEPLPVLQISHSRTRIAEEQSQKPFGVNVAGYLDSEKGTGEAARSSIRSLQAAAIPFVLNNVVDPGSANRGGEYGNFSDDNPYSVNLIHVNADQVPLFASQKGEGYFSQRYNIGFWFWESSRFPEEWCPSFQLFDEIWVASDFVLDTVSRVSMVPVVKMPLATAPMPYSQTSARRSDFDLPEDKFIFVFIFDFHSTIQRKNPFGVIDAFSRAFAKEDDVYLLLKSVHAADQPSAWDEMADRCRDKNIRIIDAVFAKPEVSKLISLADCYVSLHRSEGFGLPIAEAMSLGKPVIVTAYSGNMDFTTPANSFLVNYKLREIEQYDGPYRTGGAWAEPDLDHAATLMRYAYENRQAAKEIGTRARHEILGRFNPPAVGDRMKQRLLRISQTRGIQVQDRSV